MDYSLPLIGWILYVVVPVVFLGGTLIWYYLRKMKKKKSGSEVN